jgi:prolyl-tRNA editing enzyme YbaK/EbsC (Cys-tRNA(Pro) deacylase)
MDDPTVRDYSHALGALGIEHAIVEHPAARDYADLLGYLGLTLSDCSPTLILKADDRFLAVVLRADTRADFKKLKRALGVRNLRLATPDEFAAVTGLPVGAARVYTPGLETILDRLLFEKEYLTGGSGRFDCSIRAKAADLRKLPASRVLEITAG